MRINYQLAFNPVGQGLFYSGQIITNDSEFNFIYDCGAKRKIPLEKAIKEYCNTNKGIDLLVLSHLHSDHINGLEQLLNKYSYIPSCVVIPYLTPMERLIIHWSTIRPSKWFIEFISDPVRYLINRGVEEVICVTSSSGETVNGRLTEFEGLNPDLTGIQFERLNKEPFDRKEQISKEEYSWDSKIQDHLYLVKSGSVISCCYGMWFFKFYNEPLTSPILSLLKENLREIGMEHPSNQNLVDVFKRGSRGNPLAKAFRQVFGDDKLNLTSLLMFHGPSDGLRCGCNNLSQNMIRTNDLTLDKPSKIKNQFLHLLTGDFDFKQVSNEFYSKHGPLLEDVSVVSLPHHGSDENWTEEIISAMPNVESLVASFGTYNTYKHPGLNLQKYIKTTNHSYIECNEINNKIAFDGRICW